MDQAYPMTARGLTLVQGISAQPAERWQVSAELGFFLWGGDIRTNDDAVKLDYDDTTDLLLGARLDYLLCEHLSLGLSLKRVMFKYQDVDLIGASASWHF